MGKIDDILDAEATAVEAAELTQIATLTGVNNLQLVGLVAANFA